MIRILHCTGLDLGGAETTLMNYYRNIDKSKVQFDFFVGSSDIKRHYEDEAISLGAKIYKYTYRWWRVNELIRFMMYFVGVFKNNREIKAIHIHHYIPTLVVPLLMLAYFARVPVRIVYSTAQMPKAGLKQKLFRPMVRVLSTHWLCGSMKAGISLFGEKYKDKLIISPRARDIELFRYDLTQRNVMRNNLGISDRFVLLHVGRLHEQKNHAFLFEILPEVLKKCPNLVLLVVGTGHLHEPLMKKVSELELSEVVHFLGTRNDVSDLMQAADIFLMPSLFEGLPGAAVEAQAAGLPCLLADTISKEAKIIKPVEFLPIDKSVDIWAERILAYQNYERSSTTETLRQAGYDIRNASKNLEAFYISEVNAHAK